MNNTETMNERDRMLWKQAKKRVAFRRHLFSYIIINGMLWAIWFFSAHDAGKHDFPWPVWPSLGWGIGLVFSYYSAYIDNRADAVEREFEKLKRERN